MLQSDLHVSLAALLPRVLAGEREAFDAVVRLLWDPVMRFLWKRVPAEEAEDLAQNVFLALYRVVIKEARGPAFTDEAAWLRYVYTCARNQVTDYWRRQRASPPTQSLAALLAESEELPLASTPAHPSVPLVLEEEDIAVRDCLSQVDPPSRAWCWLHFVDGKSKREIARTLGLPESSFRVLFEKVLTSLRHCLEAKGALEGLDRTGKQRTGNEESHGDGP